MENEELYARAAFGKQVEAFWDSQIGQYLQTRAREEYTDAVQALLKVDPSDSARVSMSWTNARSRHTYTWNHFGPLLTAATSSIERVERVDRQ